MKKFAFIALVVAAVAFVTVSPAPAQVRKGDSTQAVQPKISKAEAERLALQRNPGANVLNTTQATVKGRQVWSISVATTGGNVARKVFVDQETGKLSY
jgi:uncharacterized membrane protein YkoI